MVQSYIASIEESIIQNWDYKALTDYQGSTLQYKDVARKIEKLHILFQNAGIEQGDKIAICGRNTSHWGVALLATLTYGAVAVPILHEFKADNIHNIVNHSEAKLLFAGNVVWEHINEACMPQLEGIIYLPDFSLLISRSESLTYAREHLNQLFGQKYPQYFRPTHVQYRREKAEELAIINYTSGTTGYSKGVMLSYRSIWSNIRFCHSKIGLMPGDRIVSMLPLGHVFGMTFDFLYGISAGAHIWFLTRMPSPKIIASSFSQIHPKVICCVPLVLEKIVRKIILPKVDTKLGKLLLRLPIVNEKIKERVRVATEEIFGGNFMEIIVGGAPFNQEIEAFLKMIGFHYTMAYGLTECGPVIAHSPWDEIPLGSCGRVADRMKVKVLSPDPQRIPGELLTKGENLMDGYYKNPEATAETIDKDGWLHTGDMALIDEEGFIYIKGRSKNMLLTASGQNIYPEEIESKLNNFPLIGESIVLLRDGKLIALVYPELSEPLQKGEMQDKLLRQLEENRNAINLELPAYCQISRLVPWPEEFEKTAKRSIKRYLYNNVEV